MANLKEIRRRIVSVEGTKKITSAMKMVAAAKLRKAQEAAEQFRDYSTITSDILSLVAGNVSGNSHPLLNQRVGEKTLILVVSSDKGLCGGFNTNLNKMVMGTVSTTSEPPVLCIVGKKSKAYFDYNNYELWRYYDGVIEHPQYAAAARIASDLESLYEDGAVDKVVLAYNRMESVVSQVPVMETLFPVSPPEPHTEQHTDSDDALFSTGEYLYEPSREELLAILLPRYVQVKVFGALLESVAAEHAARMTAMETATNNADDMISSLTLVYNRARQSAITNELMDIVGGAEALND